MPRAPQREAILGIVIRQHAAEVGTAQVNPKLLANEPAAPGKMRPLQLIAGASAWGPFRTWRLAHLPLTLCLAVSSAAEVPTDFHSVQYAGVQHAHSFRGALVLPAEATSGLSGSDLHQLCSHAAARPVLELARSASSPYSRCHP